MSYRGKIIAVVIPSHDEERFVGRVIATVPAFVDLIVAVDDGSEDETLARIRDAGDPRVAVIRLPFCSGAGAAVTAGCERALSLGAEMVAVMAGDGQMDPRDLPTLLDPLVEGRADYAKGNRFLDPGVRRSMPPIRQVGNFLLSALTRCVAGLPVWDSQCGYTAVTAPVLRSLLGMPACRGYGYPNRILVNLSILRKRVIDVPVRCIYGLEISGIVIPLYFFRMIFVLSCSLLYRIFSPFLQGPFSERVGGSSRVCLLTSSYPRFEGDTAGCFIRDLCRALSSEGYFFDVVAPDGEGAVPLRDEGIDVHRFAYFRPRRLQRLCYGCGIEDNLSGNVLLYLQAPLLFLFSLVNAWRFARRCDVIWSHWLVPSGLAGAILSMITGKPHVTTIHSGGLHVLRRVPFGGALGRFILRHSGFIAAVSSYSLEEFGALVGFRMDTSAKAGVIPMGVQRRTAIAADERECLRERHGLDGKCVFLYMGRLVRLKGLHTLLPAMSRVPNARLVIAGEGPEREALEGMAEELGVDVEFRGFLAGPAKYEILAACDALVYPSLAGPSGRTEGCPVAVLESLSSGRPVVASAVGGIPEVVHDGLNGYLVAAGDVHSLAERLRAISADRDLLRRLSIGAYGSGERYGLDRVAPAFKRIFQDVAG